MSFLTCPVETVCFCMFVGALCRYDIKEYPAELNGYKSAGIDVTSLEKGSREKMKKDKMVQTKKDHNE